MLIFGTVIPNHVVDVNSVNVFKARLDRFWMDQDVKFDFTADLTGSGTGDRSVNVIAYLKRRYISVIEIRTKGCSHLRPLQLVELSYSLEQ